MPPVSEPVAPRAERRLVTGALWLGAAQAAVTLGGLVGSVVAARLLEKRDIGLMGIATLLFGVLDQLSHSGFDKALVQRQKNVDDYLNVAWTWSVLRGVVLTSILVALAWPLSRFYHESVLLPVIVATATTGIIGGCTNVGQIFFSRELAFRTLFAIRAIQAVASLGVALPAIFFFRNVWALVVGYVLTAVVNVSISYIAHPYRPKLEWDTKKLRELLDYGKWLTLTAILVFVVTQGDDLFVSRWFGPADLAVYQLAYSLANLPTTHVSWVVADSTFPAYARLMAEPERLRVTFVNVMRGVLYFSGAMAVLVMALTPYIVDHVIGVKWRPIIPLVGILLVGGFIRSFVSLAGPLFQALGRTELDFKMNTPRFLVIVLLIWPACAHFGLSGASWLVAVSLVSVLPLWFFGVRLLIALEAREVLAEIAPTFVSTALLGGVLFLLRRWLGPSFLAMFGVALGGIALWLGLLELIGRVVPRLDLIAEVKRLRALLRS